MTPTPLKNQPGIALHSTPATRPAQPLLPRHAESARNDVIATTPLTANGELEKQARNLVGQTFFGTLLKQMRDSPFKSELFSGGKGGAAFGGLYDQALAERMARKAGGKLTRPIVNKFKAAADAYEKQKTAKRTTEDFSKESKYVAHNR